MGEIINFGGKKFNFKPKQEQKTDDLIALLPKLKVLKDEIIVFKINYNVIEDDNLLTGLIKEIITLKCMGCITIIVPDVNDKIEEYLQQNQGINNVFDTNIFIETNGLTDVLEVIIKHDIISKISKVFKEYNIANMALSGNDMNIIFADDVVNYNVEDISFARKSISGVNFQSQKKYSIDVLNEIIKTDIVPIVMPTFKDKNGNEYLMESGMYAMYLAKYLNALKYVVIYCDDKSIPTRCIYGVERFVKLVKSGDFKLKTLQSINATIEAVKNGVQVAHLIDIKQFSLIETLCDIEHNGLSVYDDSLNSL